MKNNDLSNLLDISVDEAPIELFKDMLVFLSSDFMSIRNVQKIYYNKTDNYFVINAIEKYLLFTIFFKYPYGYVNNIEDELDKIKIGKRDRLIDNLIKK